MEVKDRLPRRRAAGVQEVHAVGAERVLGARGEARGGGARRQVLLADRQQIARVLTGDHERVPARGRLMSMNETVRSSSATIVAGSSPATILQNRQSGSGPGMADEPISCAAPAVTAGAV